MLVVDATFLEFSCYPPVNVSNSTNNYGTTDVSTSVTYSKCHTGYRFVDMTPTDPVMCMIDHGCWCLSGSCESKSIRKSAFLDKITHKGTKIAMVYVYH